MTQRTLVGKITNSIGTAAAIIVLPGTLLWGIGEVSLQKEEQKRACHAVLAETRGCRIVSTAMNEKQGEWSYLLGLDCDGQEGIDTILEEGKPGNECPQREVLRVGSPQYAKRLEALYKNSP